MVTTELYLIRHGIAVERGSYAQDGDRPLTEIGRQKTRKVAQRLSELDLRFDLILTSPLVRARQTADILADLGLGKSVETSPYLVPEGDFEGWLSWLQRWQGGDRNLARPTHSPAPSLALVGHQPDLADWAETLVWGERRQQLVLKKAGVIGLVVPSDRSAVGNSQMFWLTPPKLLL